MVVAHSFGNFQTLNNLWNLSQVEKDTLVARYIALAPPFSGAPKASKGPFGFDSDYSFGLWLTDLGLTPNMFRDTLAKFKGIYDLMLRNVFVKHQDKDWMKDINARFIYESNKGPKPTSKTMSIFPDVTETCNSGFKNKDEYCKIGFFMM